MRILTLLACNLAFCIFTACATARPAPSPAQLELDALLKQESYDELLSKALAVPATERNDAWLNAVSMAAVKSTSKKAFKETSEAEAYLASLEDILRRFPLLKNSKPFMAHRAENGKGAFLWTYSNYRHSTGDEAWVPKVLEFVKADTVTPGLAQTYANEVVLARLVASAGFSLFQLAFERDGDAVCKDAGLPKTVVDLIDYDIYVPETQKLFERCKTAFDAAVTAKLKDPEAKDFRKHACVTLKGRAVLAGVCK
jgi:hypothetical protein